MATPGNNSLFERAARIPVKEFDKSTTNNEAPSIPARSDSPSSPEPEATQSEQA